MVGKKKKAKGSGSVLAKIPARCGAATHLQKGQTVKIINTHGNALAPPPEMFGVAKKTIFGQF